MNFLFIILLLVSCVTATTDKIVCYFGSWAVYRTGNGKFDVEDINPNLCTHIIYSFVGLNLDGSVKILDTWNEIDQKAIERFVNLKKINPDLKVMAAIGGWNEGSIKYSNVVNNPVLRSKLVQNIVAFTMHYKFDGFDLDWEYPAQRGGAASDRAAYIELIKALRSKFDEAGLLLSAAVQALDSYHATSYDVPNMTKYLDFINIMTYDFHGSYDGVTGHNAPLYFSSTDKNLNFNVDASIKGWILSGANPNKLILGMGVYGRSFTLALPSLTILGATASGAGEMGSYTVEPGILSYLEICEKLKSGQWTRVWDPQSMVPFMFNGNQWVSYDDVQSIKLKTQYAKDMKLGGAMIWSIEMDDANNVCGNGNYPILRTINDIINSPPSNEVTSIESEIPESTTALTEITTSTTTETINEIVLCPQTGFIRDPIDCSIFYYCNKIQSNKPIKFQCPQGLYFDPKINTCNYKVNVLC